MATIFNTRGERNRFMKYGMRMTIQQVWKSEMTAYRILHHAKKYLAQSK